MHVCPYPDSYLKTHFSPFYYKTPHNSFHGGGGGAQSLRHSMAVAPPWPDKAIKLYFSPLPKTLSLCFNLALTDRSQF